MTLHFKKAPAREAILEFKFEDSLSNEQLTALKTSLETHFDNVKPISKGFVQLKFEGRTVSTQQSDSIDGFKVNLSNGAEFQCLSDHIFWSKCAPYENWEDLTEPGLSVWEHVLEFYPFQRLKSVTVRFVNELVIEFDETGRVNLDDYLTVIPKAPPRSDLVGENFFSRSSYFNKTNSLHVGIAVGLKERTKEKLLVVLDIVVTRNARSGFIGSRRELASLLELLRDEKNETFISCLTKHMLEQLE